MLKEEFELEKSAHTAQAVRIGQPHQTPQQITISQETHLA